MGRGTCWCSATSGSATSSTATECTGSQRLSSTISVCKRGIGSRLRCAICRSGPSRSSLPSWPVRSPPRSTRLERRRAAFALEDSGPKVLVIADGERFERLSDYGDILRGMALVGTRLGDRKTAAPLPPGLTELASLLDRAAVAPAVAIEPDDPATIFYTSGTTDRPRGYSVPTGTCAQRRQHAVRRRAWCRRAGVAASAPIGAACRARCRCRCSTGPAAIRGWWPRCGRVALSCSSAGGIPRPPSTSWNERVTGMTAVPTMVWDLVNTESIGRPAT